MLTNYWADDYLAKQTTVQAALAKIRSGQRVFIGSGCGEPQELVRRLVAESHRLSNLEVVQVYSQETSPLAQVATQSGGQNLDVRSFYNGSMTTGGLKLNRRFITPINLSAVPRLFKSRQLPLNAALVQVSPPDDFGYMSLGISVDVTLAAAASADLVIAQVNPRVPRVFGRSMIHVNDVHILVEHEEPLLTPDSPPPLAMAPHIAKHVAKLIEDGSTLQVCLGGVAKAVLAALEDKNDLGVHSEYLTDGMMDLYAHGVINNRYKKYKENRLVAAGAIGDHNLYEFLDDNPAIELHPSDYVNDPAIIARHHKMVAINLALAIDLTGQVACEALPYNHYTGVSGVLDFQRAAMQSEGGKSILMLHSTNVDDVSVSRVLPSLDDIPVVVPCSDVQYVATEWGVVNLFGKSLQERAIALISIAHPDHRDWLFDQAKDIGLLGKERSMAETIRAVYPLDVEDERMIAGKMVHFRAARPTDERLIQEHFYNLDSSDITKRFLQEKTCFTRTEVDDFCQVDYVNDLTMLAVLGEPGFEKVIAVGGYWLEPASNLAEVAYSVDSDWQGKGISSVIQEKLAQAAQRRGIRGFRAYTTPRNKPMIRLFKRLPYKVDSKLEDDMLILTATFDRPEAPEDICTLDC